MQGATDGKPGDDRSVDVGGDRAGADRGGGVRADGADGLEALRRLRYDRFLVEREIAARAAEIFCPAIASAGEQAADAAAGRLERERQQISDEVEAAFADSDGFVAARSARMMAAGLTFEWVQWRVKVLSRWQLGLALSSVPLVLLGIWVGGAAGQMMAVTGLLISGIAAGLNFGLQSLREVVRRHDDTAEFLYDCLGDRRKP